MKLNWSLRHKSTFPFVYEEDPHSNWKHSHEMSEIIIIIIIIINNDMECQFGNLDVTSAN